MKEKNEAKLTILVSNYSKAKRVVKNVKSIFRQNTDFDFKVFITDMSCDKNQADIMRNGLQEFPDIEFIINKKNLGYSKGHNVIKGKEKGNYILVVNPDIIFEEKDTLQKMTDYMNSHPDIAILGPKQINDDGKIAMTVRAFPKLYIQILRRTFLRNLPILKNKIAYDEMSHLNYAKTQDVDWLQSSCVMIRRDFWDKVSGYDERFFLFMSDTQMCHKAWENGFRVVYYAQTSVRADGKRLSAGGIFDFFRKKVIRQHLIDAFKYTLLNLKESNPREKYYKNKK